MEKINITLPKAQFDELSKIISCETIASKGTVKAIVKVKGHDMVITGAISEGCQTGWTELIGSSVVVFDHFDGNTFRYKDKWPEVRSYKGLEFWHGGRRYVFTGQSFNLRPSDESMQLSLF